MLTCLQVAFVLIDWWLCDKELPKISHQKKRRLNRDRDRDLYLPVRLIEAFRMFYFFPLSASLYLHIFLSSRKSTQHQRQYSPLSSLVILRFRRLIFPTVVLRKPWHSGFRNRAFLLLQYFHRQQIFWPANFTHFAIMVKEMKFYEALGVSVFE